MRVEANRVARMMGFQAAGSAPMVLGHTVEHPETLATAIRIGIKKHRAFTKAFLQN